MLGLQAKAYNVETARILLQTGIHCQSASLGSSYMNTIRGEESQIIWTPSPAFSVLSTPELRSWTTIGLKTQESMRNSCKHCAIKAKGSLIT